MGEYGVDMGRHLQHAVGVRRLAEAGHLGRNRGLGLGLGLGPGSGLGLGLGLGLDRGGAPGRPEAGRSRGDLGEI